MFGARSLAVLVLSCGVVLLAALQGQLHLDRLTALSPAAAFGIAFFALVVGSSVVRFWGVGSPSATYFRIARDDVDWEGESHFLGGASLRINVGDNQDDAFDLPGWVQRLLVITTCFCVGLMTFDQRAIQALVNLPTAMGPSSSGYCPDPDAEPPTPANDPEAPGCALVRRAYALGFAKSLGDCEAKQREKELVSCDRRQRDEPLLHYSYRLLQSFWAGTRQQLDPKRWTELRDTLALQRHHLADYAESQRGMLANAPRAAHHLWTNLRPPPRAMLESLQPRTCLERSRRVQPYVETDDAGALLEHVLAQLLFETRYGPPAAYCPEMHIHWDAPLDACTRLNSDPEGFLRDSNALPTVQQVLQRHAVEQRIAELEATLPGERDVRIRGPRAPLPKVISFACYFEEVREQPWRGSETITVGGHAFEVRELRVGVDGGTRASGPELYHNLAGLLANGFSYSQLQSETPVEIDPTSQLDGSYFTPGRGYLARLEALVDVDILLGNNWVQARPDLRTVYPYHVHLRNFVHVFRRSYRQVRGRL